MTPMVNYNDCGYAILRGFFSELEISLLNGFVEPIYSKWLTQNKTAIFENKLVNMHSLTHIEYFEGEHNERAKFFEAIASTKLIEVLEDMFGSGIYFHNTQLFFNPPNKERLPYWHRDMQYSSIEDAIQRDEQHKMLSLHVRIPLLEEKGVELVSGSHKRWDTELERNVRLELNGHKNNEPLPGTVLTTLAPGDVLIFNGQMIHRGNYGLNHARKAFDLCVGKFHPITATFLDPKVLPTDEELHKITNSQWYKLAREVSQRND